MPRKDLFIHLPLFLIYRQATYFQKEKKGSIWPSGLPSDALFRLSTIPPGTIIPDEQSWHANKQCRQKSLEP